MIQNGSTVRVENQIIYENRNPVKICLKLYLKILLKSLTPAYRRSEFLGIIKVPNISLIYLKKSFICLVKILPIDFFIFLRRYCLMSQSDFNLFACFHNIFLNIKVNKKLFYWFFFSDFSITFHLLGCRSQRSCKNYPINRFFHIRTYFGGVYFFSICIKNVSCAIHNRHFKIQRFFKKMLGIV